MRVKVRTLLRRGIAASSHEDQPPLAGDLVVTERRDPRLGRNVTTARLLDERTQSVDVLPEIYDARLLWLDGHAMRLTGIERAQDAGYAQTWAIEVRQDA